MLVLWQGEAFATDEGVLSFTDSTADITFGKAVDRRWRPIRVGYDNDADSLG